MGVWYAYLSVSRDIRTPRMPSKTPPVSQVNLNRVVRHPRNSSSFCGRHLEYSFALISYHTLEVLWNVHSWLLIYSLLFFLSVLTSLSFGVQDPGNICRISSGATKSSPERVHSFWVQVKVQIFAELAASGWLDSRPSRCQFLEHLRF